MNVLVVADGHYYIDQYGDYYVDSVFDYGFYSRYLTVFDNVYSIVRTEKVLIAPKNAKLASGERVHFLPIPPSTGFWEYLRHFHKTKKMIRQYIDKTECAILRVPGVVANTVYRYFKPNKPLAIEVVVDPWEYFAKGTVKSIVRPFVRYFWTQQLKKQCQKAVGVSYVTENYLQKKYPCKAQEGIKGYFTESYSSVELPDNDFGKQRIYTKKNKYIISHVAASFSSYGKGHIILMEAIKEIIDSGYDVEVQFVGDGPLRSEFEEYAKTLGIESHVVFLGLLSSGSAVREQIGKSDLFVFPTRAEGLPRVVLEAMAEALPVISSPVCGIPEILSKECLVDYDDASGYAKKIIHLIEHPDLMSELSKINLETAYKFKKSVLMERRESFYRSLLNSTKLNNI